MLFVDFTKAFDSINRRKMEQILRAYGIAKETKKRSRRYPAKTITDADYSDDIAILANTPAQAETLLHSLE